MSGIVNNVGSKSGVISGGSSSYAAATSAVPTLSGTSLDYEEGTWMSTGIDPKNGGTGSWTVGSYNMETVSIQMARYVKIGKQVTCWFECIVRYITYAANGSVGSTNTAYGVDGLYLYDYRLPFVPDALHTSNGPVCGAMSIANNTYGTYGPPLMVRADFNSMTTYGNSYPGGVDNQRNLSGFVTYLTTS